MLNLRFSYVFIIAAFLTVLTAFQSHAQSRDYDSFDDCILDRMQGVTSDVAANSIRRACANLTRSPSATAPLRRSTGRAEILDADWSDFMGFGDLNWRVEGRNQTDNDWVHVKLFYTTRLINGSCPTTLDDYIEGPRGIIDAGSLNSGSIFIADFLDFRRLVDGARFCYRVYGYHR